MNPLQGCMPGTPSRGSRIDYTNFLKFGSLLMFAPTMNLPNCPTRYVMDCGCPTRYVVLQGAYARYTNTLMVLERALWMAVATNRTLLVDVPAVFTPALRVAPNTRSLCDILQLERFHAACVCMDDLHSHEAVRSTVYDNTSAAVSWYGTRSQLKRLASEPAELAVLASGDPIYKSVCVPASFSRRFHRLFRSPACVEQLAAGFIDRQLRGGEQGRFVGVHLRADPNPAQQYDLRCGSKAPCDATLPGCPASAHVSATRGCNMTSHNVRGVVAALWGGAAAAERAVAFVAAPPDLWARASRRRSPGGPSWEATRLLADHRVRLGPIARANATGWYEIARDRGGGGGGVGSVGGGGDGGGRRTLMALRPIPRPAACDGRADRPPEALQLDMEVLLRSTLFFGNWVSTFSLFVAKLRAARGLRCGSRGQGRGRG